MITEFKKRELPIVGQPFIVKGFVPMVQIVCNCEGKEPVLLIGNGIAQCPACSRRFQLQGIQPGPNGLQFVIGLVADTSAPAIAGANGGTPS